MDRNTNTVGVVHDGTAVSVTESLTQIEIEIINKTSRGPDGGFAALLFPDK